MNTCRRGRERERENEKNKASEKENKFNINPNSCFCYLWSTIEKSNADPFRLLFNSLSNYA